MSVAKRIQEISRNSSWIRKMFSEGSEMKKKWGADKVCDFSIGNPDLLPPEIFDETLKKYAGQEGPGYHGYMPNAGYPEVRARVAEFCSKEQETKVTAESIVMSCGAGGGLNAIFRALLNPGDEVIVTAPYFVEYGFYAENHGGRLIPIPAADDFEPDLEAIEAAINPKTAVMLINSPNNPTGKIYTKETIAALADLLRRKSAEIGRPIYLVSDEPYRKIAFGHPVPPLFSAYEDTLIVTSYSKDLSIPGERIGFIAVNPQAGYFAEVTGALALTTRILGFVNAPGLMQRVVGDLQGLSVDIDIYRKRRDLLCQSLEEIGYSFYRPDGAFYLFVKAPGGDDVAFVNRLKQERILTVPGRGFGYPGYFRVSFCVANRIIESSLAGFRAAWNQG